MVDLYFVGRDLLASLLRSPHFFLALLCTLNPTKFGKRGGLRDIQMLARIGDSGQSHRNPIDRV